MNTLKEQILFNILMYVFFLYALALMQFRHLYMASISFIICGIIAIKFNKDIAALYPNWMQTPRSIALFGGAVILVGLILGWLNYSDV